MGKKITKYDVKLVKEECKIYDLDDTKVDSSRRAGELVQTVVDIHDWTVEKFGMLCLDAQNNIIGIHILFVGGISETMIDIRVVFQRALLNNACKILLFHNHPSGSPTPSRGDLDATSKIVEAGKIIQIQVVDHIIVYGKGEYTSLAEKGLL